MGQFIFLDDDGRTVTVEDFANRLLLGQDEAALRCGRIDGHDEDDHITAVNEVADDGSLGISRLQPGQFFLQFMDAVAGQGTDMDGIIDSAESVVERSALL